MGSNNPLPMDADKACGVRADGGGLRQRPDDEWTGVESGHRLYLVAPALAVSRTCASALCAHPVLPRLPNTPASPACAPPAQPQLRRRLLRRRLPAGCITLTPNLQRVASIKKRSY